MPPTFKRLRLPPIAATFFRRFVEEANRSNLHDLDRERFYEFVAACHRFRVRAGHEDVKDLILAADFDDVTASSLANIYHHGRRILRATAGVSAYCENERRAKARSRLLRDRRTEQTDGGRNA